MTSSARVDRLKRPAPHADVPKEISPATAVAGRRRGAGPAPDVPLCFIGQVKHK
jgi:hypothetical protein